MNHTLATAREVTAQQKQLQRLEELTATIKSGTDEAGPEVIDLREYWRILVGRKRTVLTFLGVAILAALLFTFLSTPIFRATLLLKIEREEGKVLDFQSLSPQEAATAKDFYQTQYSLLQSRSLARRVIDQLGLRAAGSLTEESKPTPVMALFSEVTGWIQGQAAPTENERIDLEKLFLDHLTIAPEKNSRLVQINYDSPIPEEAAAIANALAENFVNSSLERRFEASAYAKTFLDERIEQVRRDLEASEQRQVDYAKDREIINLEDRFDIVMERLKQMSAQLGVAEAERIDAEAKYHEIQQHSGASTVALLDSTLIQNLKERKATLEAEYQEKSEIYQPGYPKMQELQRQIRELQQEITQEATAIHSAAKTTFQAAVRREAMLRGRVREIKDEILALQERSSGYQTLKRDVETNRELYDGLLQRMKEIGISAGIGTNNISIVDRAEVPFKRYKPSLKKNLALALGIGLFGGILLAFVLESADDTLKTGSEVEKKVGAPILGIIPLVDAKTLSIADTELAMTAHHDPTSPLAEAYRSLRTALLFSNSDGAPKILHFTSSGPQEGKTTSATNTAIAFAQAGAKVLLIDADLRNPSIHKAFNLSNSLGLTNYLTGDLDPTDVAQPTQVTRLFAITRGIAAPHPVELLSSAKMLDLLSIAAEKFDYVILDGPPVLGLADALVLANLATASVFVVASGSTTSSAVDNSVKRLASAGALLLGAVLTKCSKGSYGYGYGYDYHYSYGGQEEGRQAALPLQHAS